MSKHKGLTVRRDIVKLWNSAEEFDWKELDRIMIAFLHLETEGRVAYRRFVGTHGGGGGTNDKEYENILKVKVRRDRKRNDHRDEYSNSEAEGEELKKVLWPGAGDKVPNFPENEETKSPFAHFFCWHGGHPFLVWHRAFMREYERLLQEYDPEDLEEKQFGSEALGAPYWNWDEWDGKNLPEVAALEEYEIRTEAYASKGYKKGDKITNPYFRWFAPVSIANQKKEFFQEKLTDKTSTFRNVWFDKHNSKSPPRPWQKSGEGGESESHFVPAHRIIRRSVNRPYFGRIGTTGGHELGVEEIKKIFRGGGNTSLEEPHNRFHNLIGGERGAMVSLQSAFDPIFMLHHCNVERHLCSWQRVFIHGKEKPKHKSLPTPFEKMTLFPWTKPELLEQGHSFWNTPSTRENDGTMMDWFMADLTYEYDNYVTPTEDMLKAGHDEHSVVAEVFFPEQQFALNYVLLFSGKPIATLTALRNTEGSPCMNCRGRGFYFLFDVTHVFKTLDEVPVGAFEKFSVQVSGGDVEPSEGKFARIVFSDESNSREVVLPPESN